MKEGIHKLSYKEYDAIDAIRQSHLGAAHISPLQFRYDIDNPQPSTAAMILGTATHTRVLEPDNFSNEVAVFTGAARRGAAWERFKIDNEDKTILTKAEAETLDGMAESFAKHPFTKNLLADATVEQSTIWRDESGLLCKARQDIVLDGVVYDLKTTSDISDNGIFYSAKNFGYRDQAAFYLDGLNAATGENYENFTFIFIQKQPPHDIKILAATERFLQYGRQRNREALDKIAECTERGQWPGAYTNTIGIIDISEWEASYI
jgi:hypothetical protein